VPEHIELDERTDEMLQQHLLRRAVYSRGGSQTVSQRLDVLRNLERYVCVIPLPLGVPHGPSCLHPKSLN
jgi:hypothetical protein